MTDKTHEDFEAWHLKQYTKFDCGNKDDRAIVWQAATLKERERCAMVCESMRMDLLDKGHIYKGYDYIKARDIIRSGK